MGASLPLASRSWAPSRGQLAPAGAAAASALEERAPAVFATVSDPFKGFAAGPMGAHLAVRATRMGRPLLMGAERVTGNAAAGRNNVVRVAMGANDIATIDRTQQFVDCTSGRSITLYATLRHF